MKLASRKCRDKIWRETVYIIGLIVLISSCRSSSDASIAPRLSACSDYDTATLTREDFLFPPETPRELAELSELIPEVASVLERDRNGAANKDDAALLMFAYSEMGDRKSLLRWCPIWLEEITDGRVVSGAGDAIGYETCKDAFLHEGRVEEALVYLDSIDHLLARDPKAQESLPEGFPFLRFWDRAEIYEFQGRRQEVLDLLLPHAVTWGAWGAKRPLFRAIRHTYSQSQILSEFESAEAELKVGELQDAPPIVRTRVDSLTRGSEYRPTLVGWTEMFGRPIHLLLQAPDSSLDLRAQYLNLFRESAFYQGLRCAPPSKEQGGKDSGQ